jgi:TIR domain
MADRDAWKKAESLSKIFAAVFIPVVLGVASLLANQALEKSKTRDELLKQGIDVVFLSKSDQMAGVDKSFEGRSPLLFKPNGYYTSSRGKVFISYRRDDSAAYAGRVWDRLERDLGRDFLFMDVDAIPLGTNFSKILHEKVDKCGVLLAMIGANWLDARDEYGNRRLDDPNDFVRIEIAAALQRNIPVIPILLDGARIPKATQLPEDLKELAVRNGMEIRHASFHGDMNRLIRELKGQLDQAGSSDERTTADAQQSDPAVVQTVHLRAHTDDRATVSKIGTGNLIQLFHPR